ncbi:MAG: hypothetical protein JWN32_649 [Solirubrobacterales bacterium]|nr:hypothetical protein [Solirubrobacterales bacterium]
MPKFKATITGEGLMAVANSPDGAGIPTIGPAIAGFENRYDHESPDFIAVPTAATREAARAMVRGIVPDEYDVSAAERWVDTGD